MRGKSRGGTGKARTPRQVAYQREERLKCRDAPEGEGVPAHPHLPRPGRLQARLILKAGGALVGSLHTEELDVCRKQILSSETTHTTSHVL